MKTIRWFETLDVIFASIEPCLSGFYESRLYVLVCSCTCMKGMPKNDKQFKSLTRLLQLDSFNYHILNDRVKLNAH